MLEENDFTISSDQNQKLTQLSLQLVRGFCTQLILVGEGTGGDFLRGAGDWLISIAQ